MLNLDGSIAGKPLKILTGWPQSSQDKIPRVFPEFSLC